MLAALLALIVVQGTTVAPSVLPPHCVRTIDTHGSRVQDIDISTDGERLLVGCQNGHAHVYALLSGEEIHDFFDRPAIVWSVAFDPRGERLVSVLADRAVLWNARTFEREHELTGQMLGMMYACFSPDSRWIAIGSCGNPTKPDEPTEARVWDAASGELAATIPGTGFRALPSFSPDSRDLLVSSQSSPTAFVFRLADQRIVARMTGKSGNVAWSTWSPDGKSVITIASDFAGRLWNAETGREIRTLEGHTGYGLACGFSPDGKEASTTSWVDRTTRIWNVKTGKSRLVLEGHTERPTRSRFSPDGRVFASADAAGHALVFELEHGKVVAKLDGHEGIVSGLEFTPDSKRIVTGGYDGLVRIWENPLSK